MSISFQRLLLFRSIGLQPGHELVEVDLMAVELGAVDAGELRLTADGDPAGAAHARAVHHDGVQADDGLYMMWPGGFGRHLHHDGRADDDDAVDFDAAVDQFHERVDREPFPAFRAVVRDDVKLVAYGSQTVFPE